MFKGIFFCWRFSVAVLFLHQEKHVHLEMCCFQAVKSYSLFVMNYWMVYHISFAIEYINCEILIYSRTLGPKNDGSEDEIPFDDGGILNGFDDGGILNGFFGVRPLVSGA